MAYFLLAISESAEIFTLLDFVTLEGSESYRLYLELLFKGVFILPFAPWIPILSSYSKFTKYLLKKGNMQTSKEVL